MATKQKNTEAPRKPGRPSTFAQEVADAICARLAEGESLRAICRDADMPEMRTVMRWLDAADADGFRQQYARAREVGMDAMAEELLDIADEAEVVQKVGRDGETMEVTFDSTAVARNRLRVDTRKWLLSKMAPKKYGDKLAVGGDPDAAPIQHQHAGDVTLSPSDAYMRMLGKA